MVAEALIYRVIYLFGSLRQIICDEAMEFSSAIIQAILCMLNCRLKVISPYNHGSSKCKRQIRMISEIIMKHLWDKGQMWPLFATTAAYAMNTFASEALSGLSPFQLVFLRDPPYLKSLSFPKIDTIPVKYRENLNSGYLTHHILGPKILGKYLEAVEDDLEETAPEFELVFTSVYQYCGNSLISFTNTIDDLLLQLPILIKLKVQVPMSLFSIKTAPVPLDAETYIGEKREYTQIIPETQLIALIENNYIPLTQAQILLCAKIGYMYYCEYAHLLKKRMEHTCMSAIYYDQGSDIKAKQCKTIVTFDTTPESKILDAGDLLILSNLQKPWTIACKDVSPVFEIEYSTYCILNRSELCECSLTTGNYLLSYTNINCGNAPEARDGYFTTYYSFNKIVLDVITKKFDIQVDENTRTQAALLHNDIPGYDLPTIDFVQTSKDDDKDFSILEEDNSQIYAHLNNVLVHMIDKQEAAIFKSKQDFNQNKEKILEYIKYAENWQVILVICSYAAMACNILLIVAMIVFLLKYRKTMQAMLAAFLQMNTKNTGIQSVQADQIGRTYPPLFTLNLPKEEEIIDDLKEIMAMEYVVQFIMIIVYIAVVIIVIHFCCTKCRHTCTIFKYCFQICLLK